MCTYPVCSYTRVHTRLLPGNHYYALVLYGCKIYKQPPLGAWGHIANFTQVTGLVFHPAISSTVHVVVRPGGSMYYTSMEYHFRGERMYYRKFANESSASEF